MIARPPGTGVDFSMRMISEADAFRGRWSVHPLGWVLLAVPVIALVALQETSIGFPTFVLVVVSGLAQHIAAGLLIVGVGGYVLRRSKRIPLPVIFTLWAASGVARGLVGGALAAVLSAQEPQFAYRITYWCTVTLIWMPLFTYLLAQLEYRSVLLSELDRMQSRLMLARDRARRTVDERTAELVAAVREAVAPLIDEVRQALQAAAEHDSEIALDTISRRLEHVADEVEAVVRPTAVEQSDETVGRPQFSLLVDALDFSRSRPLFAAALTTVAVTALFVPESLRATHWADVAGAALAIAAGGVALATALLVQRRLATFTTRNAVIAFLFSTLAVQVVMLAGPLHSADPRDLALVVAIPLAFGSAAAMLCSAVGVAHGNAKAIATYTAYADEAAEIEQQSRSNDGVIAHQVSEILHGPIVGRLSACIMALNFYLAEPENRRGLRRNATTSGVLAHLDLVASDLAKLGLSSH